MNVINDDYYYYYHLNEDHTYQPCDALTWVKQFQNENIHVGDDIINDFRVSTVWLGTNHNHSLGAPILFETMVFNTRINKYSDEYCRRYTTWDEALEGHQKAIQWVKDIGKDNESTY